MKEAARSLGIRVIIFFNYLVAGFILLLGLACIQIEKSGIISGILGLSFFALFSCLFILLAQCFS